MYSYPVYKKEILSFGYIHFIVLFGIYLLSNVCLKIIKIHEKHSTLIVASQLSIDGCTKKKDLCILKKVEITLIFPTKRFFDFSAQKFIFIHLHVLEITIYQIKIKIPYAIYYTTNSVSSELTNLTAFENQATLKTRENSSSSNVYPYFLHYLLYPAISSSIGSCPQTTRPILHRRAPDFSPQRRYIDSSEERDRRHAVRRHLRHAIFSMDETFDAIILKARRERIHSGRLLHGTMAAGALKPP